MLRRLLAVSLSAVSGFRVYSVNGLGLKFWSSRAFGFQGFGTYASRHCGQSRRDARQDA